MNVFMNEVVCPLETRAEQEVNMSKVSNYKLVSKNVTKISLYLKSFQAAIATGKWKTIILLRWN